jgi:hypothetical protein
MEIPPDVRRGMEASAAVRAAADILNQAIQEAAILGLLVTVDVRLLELGEPGARAPQVAGAVDKG